MHECDDGGLGSGDGSDHHGLVAIDLLGSID
jgi:hypothetical protein